LRIIVGTLAIAAVLAIGIAVRISSGPVDVSFLKPKLEKSINSSTGLKASFNSLRLGIYGDRPALVGSGANFANENGLTIASADSVEIRLDLAALLQGDIKPSRLDIEKASLLLTKNKDSAVTLNPLKSKNDFRQKQTSYDLFNIAKEWIADKIQINDPLDILLEEASLTVVDETTNDELFSAKTNLGLTLTPERIVFWADIVPNLNISSGPLKVTASLSKGKGGFFTVRLNNNDLGSVSQVGRLLDYKLGEFTGKISGDLRFDFDQDLKGSTANASISTLSTHLFLTEGRKIAVGDASAEISADFGAGQIVVKSLKLGKELSDVVLEANIIQNDSIQKSGTYDIIGQVKSGDIQYFLNILDVDNQQLSGLGGNITADFKFGISENKLTTARSRIQAYGQYTNTKEFSEKIEFNETEAKVQFDANSNSILVYDIKSIISGIDALGEANLKFGKNGNLFGFNGNIRTGSFPVEKLSKIWPQNLASGGRLWVKENLSLGKITNSNFSISKTNNQPAKVSGSFSAESLTVRYWKPMPVATEVSGTGYFEGDTLDLHVNAATSSEQTSNKIDLKFTELGSANSALSIVGNIAGPVPDLLHVLEADPLRYASWLGVKAEETDGLIKGELKISFPLKKDLTLSDVVISADGEVSNGLFPRSINGWDLTAEILNISVNQDDLRLAGKGQLLEAPIKFGGFIPFDAKNQKSLFNGTWLLDEKVRSALSDEASILKDMVKGLSPTNFNVIAAKDGRMEIKIDADIEPSEVSIEKLGYHKEPKVPGNFRAVLMLNNGKLEKLEDIQLFSEDFDLSARVEFQKENNSIKVAEISRLVGLGHDLKMNFSASSDGKEHTRIWGKSFDYRPVIAMKKQIDQEKKNPENFEGDHTIEIDLDRVRVSENFSIDDVHVVFLDDPRLPKFLDAEAHYEGGVIKASSLPSDPPAVVISASNFGRLLDAMGITSAAEAGIALLTLEENENGNLKINFKADEFDFKKTAIRKLIGDDDTSLLSELKNVGGLTGTLLLSIIDGGDAIRFDHFELDGTYKFGLLEIEGARAEGSALAISAKGEIDIGNDTFEIEGAISPAYIITRTIDAFPLFDQLPLLRQIITGTGEEGIFATNYRAFGPLEDPEFTISPLSTFAPGILRDVLPAPTSNQEELSPISPPPEFPN